MSDNKEKEIALNDKVINIKDPILSQLEKIKSFKSFLESEEGKDIKECFSKIEILIEKFPTELELVVDYELLAPQAKTLADMVNKIEKEGRKMGCYRYLKEKTIELVGILERKDHKSFEEKKEEIFEFYKNLEECVEGFKVVSQEELIQIFSNKNTKRKNNE